MNSHLRCEVCRSLFAVPPGVFATCERCARLICEECSGPHDRACLEAEDLLRSEEQAALLACGRRPRRPTDERDADDKGDARRMGEP